MHGVEAAHCCAGGSRLSNLGAVPKHRKEAWRAGGLRLLTDWFTRSASPPCGRAHCGSRSSSWTNPPGRRACSRSVLGLFWEPPRCHASNNGFLSACLPLPPPCLYSPPAWRTVGHRRIRRRLRSGVAGAPGGGQEAASVWAGPGDLPARRTLACLQDWTASGVPAPVCTKQFALAVCFANCCLCCCSPAGRRCTPRCCVRLSSPPSSAARGAEDALRTADPTPSLPCMRTAIPASASACSAGWCECTALAPRTGSTCASSWS